MGDKIIMTDKLLDLYKSRTGKYSKPREEEDFLNDLNQILLKEEKGWYKDYNIEHPFIFIFGLPRSGTTLLSQFVAHSFDTGFVNNLMARFYLAPLHGIRLSKQVLGNRKQTIFSSDYARTDNLSDIHEFGYFWRYWLKKEHFSGVTKAKEIEKQIEWQDLKKVLSSIQHEFGKPLVFKNIFGSYHISKLISLLNKTLFIYIERDELDVAVSILGARKKYYDDLNTWWSYMPPEYDKIKDLDYWDQISGQIFYLKKYYYSEIEKNSDHIISISYKELCESPSSIVKKIQDFFLNKFNYNIKLSDKIVKNFPFRTYNNSEEEKLRFKDLISKYR